MISLLLVACPALSQEDEPDSLAVEPVQIQTILPSGMQVLIKSLPDAALTRVGMFYAAGSALEPDSLAGLAHLSEHLLTESSLNYPDGELIRQQTLYSTYRNAYTGSAYMQFDTECLPVFLPRILELEADRQRGVVTDPVSFARERSVVLEELAMRQRLTPPQEFTEKVFHACYPGHPFGRSVGGTAESVSRIGIDDFLEFQQRYIRPEKSALIVIGPVDPDSTLAIIEEYFGFGPRDNRRAPGNSSLSGLEFESGHLRLARPYGDDAPTGFSGTAQGRNGHCLRFDSSYAHGRLRAAPECQLRSRGSGCHALYPGRLQPPLHQPRGPLGHHLL